MLNAVLKTTAAAIGGDTDRSLEPVLLFCLLHADAGVYWIAVGLTGNCVVQSLRSLPTFRCHLTGT